MTPADVQAALDTGESLNAILSRLGLTTSPAPGLSQKHVHAANGRVLTAGTAHHVSGWLRTVADGRAFCPGCGHMPEAAPAYVGWDAICECYNGCEDGNRNFRGTGKTAGEALYSWREWMIDRFGAVMSDIEQRANREVYLAEIDAMDPPLDYADWLAQRGAQ